MLNKKMQSLISILLILFSGTSNSLLLQSTNTINNYILLDNVCSLIPTKRTSALTGTWKLETAKIENKNLELNADNPIKISFYKNHIKGFAVLNDYFALYDIPPEVNKDKKTNEKKNLKISQELYISKEVGDLKLMELSANYLKALKNIDAYYYENRELVLVGENIELRFKKTR